MPHAFGQSLSDEWKCKWSSSLNACQSGRTASRKAARSCIRRLYGSCDAMSSPCHMVMMGFKENWASAQVGRVHPALNRLTKSELLSSEHLAQQAQAKNISQRIASNVLHVIERLHQLKPGSYLVTHKRNSPTVSCYQSCPAPGPKVTL